jgi:hypothetical protein
LALCPTDFSPDNCKALTCNGHLLINRMKQKFAPGGWIMLEILRIIAMIVVGK